MAEPIPAGELHDRTSEVLRRVEAGEHLDVTVDGRPVAQIIPLPARRQWIPAGEILDRIQATQADPGLAAELDEMFDTRIGD